MRSGTRDKSSAIERIRCRLAADKKKAVTAACLVAVMVLMWGKLLLKKGPDSAMAGANAGGTVEAQATEPEVKVSYISLPQITGRNDVITRDFFSPAGWRGFGIGTEVDDSTGSDDREVVSDSSSEKILARIEGRLELQGVLNSEPPQASINNKLVMIGDIIKVDSGDETYECEVTEIEENRVSLQYREVKVVLKLKGALK